MNAVWALVTGEYPPQRGGVADYTQLLARALAQAGDEVHVFSPATCAVGPGAPGVQHHCLRAGFSPRGLAELGRELGALPATRRLLVQWVPHAYGLKAMNVPLALFLARQDELWVTFHEVRYPTGTGVKGDILAAVTGFMSGRLARAARKIFVTIPAWGEILCGLGARAAPTWLPVPSNVPDDVSAGDVSSTRERLGGGEPLVGHFGTFGPSIADLLEPALAALAPRVKLVLLGAGGAALARRASIPSERVVATGALAAEDVARHLAACDVVLQPYPDGATSRRGSLMAALALGRPVVTNEGALSEPLWRESHSVELAPASGEGLASAVQKLLAAPEERRRLGESARELYQRRFALAHTVRALREAGA